MTQRSLPETQPIERPFRRSLMGSFSRSQVASVTATAADFVLLFFLVEVCHVWYVAATALGALLGAVINFVMNRHWSFLAVHHHWSKQAVRYAWVSGLSLVLNSLGVYLMTDGLHFHYSISVVVVSALVGFCVNFPLHRHYVFR